MISITTQRLLLVYSDLILQKKGIFSLCKKFLIGCGPFYLLNSWPFWPVIDSKFCLFFKYSLNFQGHAQKFKLIKVWHANFIEFKYDRTNPQNEWPFQKTNKQCFCLYFANSNIKVIFSHFILSIKKKLFDIWNLHNLCVQ